MESTPEEIEKVKKDLPSIEVLVDGRFIWGRPRHSKKYPHVAKVLIDLNGENEVLEFTWSAIARAAYHNEVLYA